MKPWHLKATYQLYDEKGKPTEQGTYEYWWASPKVYRSTWTRPSATHTDWDTADGRHEYVGTGEALKYFEHQIQSSLLSPLPTAADLDPGNGRLDLQSTSAGGVKFPCVMLVPPMPKQFGSQIVPLGLFPTYCFDPKQPILRMNTSLGAVEVIFEKIVKMQGKYIARDFAFSRDNNRLLSVTVDTIEGIAATDPALTPQSEAQVTNPGKAILSAGLAAGMLVKKVAPYYPQDAKSSRIAGTVVLKAVIGRDGAIYDLHVVSTPSPSLAAATLWSVSQWQYKPYMLNGQPVEVETTINVIFSLSG